MPSNLDRRPHDDQNPCTEDTCDAATGCVHGAVADGTPCADSDWCDGVETCQAGVCAAGRENCALTPGWGGPKPERHHDYIDVSDFPVEWLGWPITVEVEAKAKELAVARLIADLGGTR